MLRLAGIDQWAIIQRGEGAYAVADLSIKYRMPARLDDELVVVSSIRQVRAASVLIHQRGMRGDEVLIDAVVAAGFLSKEGRPQRQPRDWVVIFKRLEGEKEE